MNDPDKSMFMTGVIVFLGVSVIYVFFRGVIVLYKVADDTGFFRVILYFAAWIFAFPLMALLSFLAGFLGKGSQDKEQR